ncbi:glycosyltransferase family 2 protein [Radiobacillus sp. PE A8.2]|uniref:glycosyltransferase family 2 protein n=1 Tax=Radiobacillus sp. PE A8.2 TaxID=3380349 RepID=UPI00388F25A5
MEKKQEPVQINSYREKDLPLVSIVTVCFNSANTIEDTIKSIKEQTYPNIEYIIVDGGSTDNTLDIIKKNEKYVAKWVSESDKGIYDAMNKGIAMCSGEIIGIINSDDWFEYEAVALSVEAIKNQKISFSYGIVNWLDFENERVDKFIPEDEDQLLPTAMHKCPIHHPSLFIKKEVYDEIGNYDTKYKIVADYDLILRMLYSGYKGVKINKPIANFRLGGESANKKKLFQEKRDLSIVYGVNKRKANLKYNVLLFRANLIKLIPKKIQKTLKNVLAR